MLRLEGITHRLASAPISRGRRHRPLRVSDLPPAEQALCLDAGLAERYFMKLGFIKNSFVRLADRSVVEELCTRLLGGTLHPDLGGTALTASLSKDKTRIAIINLEDRRRGPFQVRTGRGVSLALLSRMRTRLCAKE